jgi:hypothetical protein
MTSRPAVKPSVAIPRRSLSTRWISLLTLLPCW